MPTNVGLLQQIAPLAVLILVPVFALGLFSFIRPRIRDFSMALGALLPWNWGYSHEKEGGHGRKKRVRTRAEQLAESKTGTKENIPDEDAGTHAEDALFPGLVNMSGTHCFMNSTLQALASLSTLPLYLLSIRTRAEALDVPTPVVDALIDLLAALNTPDPSGRPLRATALVEALCTPPPSLGPSSAASPRTRRGPARVARAPGRAGAPQELFQLLSECVREENARVGRESARDRGFAGVTAAAAPADDDALAGVPSPFDGLTATRRACLRCGYTAAIRHFAFDTVQLALESTGGGWGGTTLNALLGAYTTLEVLNDCPCRRCELRATARRLREDIERLSAPCAPSMALPNGHAHANGDAAPTSDDEEEEEKPPKPRRKKAKTAGAGSQAAAPTPSRLRRLKAVRRMEARVLRALDAGRIEEEELEGEWDWAHGADASALRGTGDALMGVRIERVSGGVCTRQSMLGRPPAVLALHMNRSVHTAFRVAKNGARVAFPELLDLAPYTTDGVLSLDPTAALSGAAGADGAGASRFGTGRAVVAGRSRLPAAPGHV
ncbi:hypothetical protein GGX14DRAFT_607992 [Mycena pura]|uniref:ubiquitinyl hydrolase 1 n=1 Tax=Mycena pura TaxID=153505 RepID=A0AAD6UKT2_9AGAR|nr:hypothetical protein GGX14DRAFT_607992 [Mycena pura]